MLSVGPLGKVEELMIDSSDMELDRGIEGFEEVAQESLLDITGNRDIRVLDFADNYDWVVSQVERGFERTQRKHTGWKAPKVRIGMFQYGL